MSGGRGLWAIDSEAFQGIVEKAAPGTHEGCAAVIRQYARHLRQAPYLELATGNGALAARLAALGFTDADAVDLDPQQNRYAPQKVLSRDLNRDFAGELPRKSYGLVTAVEIIEHLDNPRHFVGEVKKLLQPDGLFLVSSPNVEHWLSRVKFLLTGQHRYFGPSDYQVQRHINPLTVYQMRCILEENGFDLVAVTTAGQTWGTLKKTLLAPLMALRLLMKGHRGSGEVNIFLARQRT